MREASLRRARGFREPTDHAMPNHEASPGTLNRNLRQDFVSQAVAGWSDQRQDWVHKFGALPRYARALHTAVRGRSNIAFGTRMQGPGRSQELARENGSRGPLMEGARTTQPRRLCTSRFPGPAGMNRRVPSAAGRPPRAQGDGAPGPSFDRAGWSNGGAARHPRH